MNVFMGYNPLATKQAKVTVWVCEQDGETPVAPSNPSEGDCFVVYATDEAVLSNTPTSAKTYSNGEWIDAESGGGGDSDFTTAQVTIVDSGTGSISNPYAIAAIIGDEFHSTAFYARDSSYTMEVPLYKGKQTVNVSEDIVVSGNATYDSENDIAIITGDCSLKGALLY